MYFDKELFYEATGINLNKYNLVTKIEVEYYPNSSNTRSMSIWTSPMSKSSLNTIYEELGHITRGLLIKGEEIDYKIYSKIENYIALSIKSENKEGTIQTLYEFVRKGE